MMQSIFSHCKHIGPLFQNILYKLALFSLEITSPKLDPIGKNSNFYHLNLKDIPNSEMNIKIETSYLPTILKCQLSTVIK